MAISQAEADRRRYKRDKKKRIAAQKKQDAKEKRENPAAYKAKMHAQDTRPEKPAGQKCQVGTCNKPATTYHHLSYNPPRGIWTCDAHNPRGAAA